MSSMDEKRSGLSLEVPVPPAKPLSREPFPLLGLP
jgi:hypothetical protein